MIFLDSTSFSSNDLILESSFDNKKDKIISKIKKFFKSIIDFFKNLYKSIKAKFSKVQINKLEQDEFMIAKDCTTIEKRLSESIKVIEKGVLSNEININSTKEFDKKPVKITKDELKKIIDVVSNSYNIISKLEQVEQKLLTYTERENAEDIRQRLANLNLSINNFKSSIQITMEEINAIISNSKKRVTTDEFNTSNKVYKLANDDKQLILKSINMCVEKGTINSLTKKSIKDIAIYYYNDNDFIKDVMLLLRKNKDIFFDKHIDSEILPSSEWDKDYLNKQLREFDKNFSFKRFLHILSIVKSIKK